MEECKTVIGIRGKELIYYKGFTYSRKRVCKSLVQWRCAHGKLYDCKVNLFTTKSPYSVANLDGEHSHPLNPEELEIIRVRQEMREKVVECDYSLKEILKTTLDGASETVRKYCQEELPMIKRDLRRYRMKYKSNLSNLNDTCDFEDCEESDSSRGPTSFSAQQTPTTQQPRPSTSKVQPTSSPLPIYIPTTSVNVPQAPPTSDNVKLVPPSSFATLPAAPVQLPPPMARKPPTPPPFTHDTCIKVQWNSYATNMSTVMPNLLEDEKFVDVTLACDGKYIKCHKIILGACSSYFEELLSANPCQHPIILMTDFEFWEIKVIIDFIYSGSVNISQEKLPNILEVAN